MQLAGIVYDGVLQRRQSDGDLDANYDPIPPATDTTNTTLAVTPAMILNNPVFVRTPAGVSTDTYPTADSLVAAMLAGLNGNGIPRNLAFKWRVINLSANLITGAVTANTGATMTRGNIAASTTKDFQIKITNGTPLRIVNNVVSANASALLTGFSLDDIRNLSLGMVVQNAVVNLQGQTIIGIDVGAKTVTMSGNANGAGPSNITFSPTYTITGLAA